MNLDSQIKMDNNFKSISEAEEVNLPEVVAGFEMLAVDIPEQDVSPIGQRRSLRKRKPIRPEFEVTNFNRRCRLRPKKRTFSEMENEDQIKEYYLDKTVKKYTNSLETIFEEKDDSSSAHCMSVKRFKRMIQFTSEPTDSKLKKRREKVKKVFGSKIIRKKKKYVSMQSLLDKLNGLQNDVQLTNSKENE